MAPQIRFTAVLRSVNLLMRFTRGSWFQTERRREPRHDVVCSENSRSDEKVIAPGGCTPMARDTSLVASIENFCLLACDCRFPFRIVLL